MPRAQQLADPFVVDPGIVAGESQACDAAVANGIKQAFGNAAKAKASSGDQHVVGDYAFESGGGIRINL